MVAKINGFFSMHMPYSDKGNDTSWVTCGDNGQAVMYYLFNDKSNLLGDLDTATSIEVRQNFYFDSELECHRALYSYYLYHREQYPYIGRYNELVNEIDCELNGQDEVCSEVMRFI